MGDPPTTTAYLYKRHGFRFILNQKLTGVEATPDTGFGSAVAISKDVILIGAPGENGMLINIDAFSSGAVYVFRLTADPESPWVETQHLDLGPSPSPGPRIFIHCRGANLRRRQRGSRDRPLRWELLISI